MHGHYQKKLEQDPGINKPLSFLLKKDRYIIPECENYLLATQDKSFLQNTCYTNKPKTKAVSLITSINIDCACLL